MATRKRNDQVMGRAQIADFISPDNGIRGTMVRKGMQPRNHMKENFRNIKESQARNRELREQNDQNKDLYKLPVISINLNRRSVINN